MAKKIRVFCTAVEKIDTDSIGISLDFDGIENVDEMKKVVDMRLQAGNQVTIGDVLVVIWAINKENRKRSV